MARVVLWTVVTVGCFAGVLAWATGGDATPVIEQTAVPAVSPVVAGVAERAAATWVLDGSPLEVRSASAVAASEVDGGSWWVTVAVDVAERVDDESVVTVWWVGVTVDGDARVVGGPAVVPAPLLVAAGSAPTGLRAPDDGDPVASTVAGFLAAMLSGEGATEPYLASGSGSVDGAGAFASIALDRMASQERDDGSLEVFVEVEAITAGGARLRLFYEFVLVRSGDRWLVESFGPPRSWGAAFDLGEAVDVPAVSFSSAPGA